MKKLSENDMAVLREKGLLQENEVAFKEGGITIAENVITNVRRQINTTGLLLESNRQLLTD
jgi:hypothetical protein